jgi:two-component system alkaline phosphatase synthesis response regulator PhoP
MAETAKPTILVADDDPDIVDVQSAPNGQECLRKLRQRKPALLILDVMMTTETEGFHVAYEIREDPNLRDLPVLMLTAIEQKTGFKFSPDEDGDFLPVQEFATKPIEPDDLVTRVKGLIAKSNAKK